MNQFPLIECLTNTVAAEFTANILLAAGAKPAMMENPEEAAELAAVSDAVLVNIGTLTPPQAETMKAAVRVCADKGIPWVLDPVAIHLLTYRRTFVQELFQISLPTLIRGNLAEIHFLRQTILQPTTNNQQPTTNNQQPTTLLATGEVDEILASNQQPTTNNQQPTTNNQQPTTIPGGTPMLQDVTATGCAQGAICAMFLGRGLSPVDAAVAASRLMKTAGERAAKLAKAPGSFRTALVDAIYDLALSDK